MAASKKIVASDAITNVEMTLNLNGTNKPITKAFSFLKHTDDASPYVPNPATYSSVVSMNIADQNGNNHVFSTYFAKTARANEWNAYVFVDGRNIDTVKHDLTIDNNSLPPLDLPLSEIDLSSATNLGAVTTLISPIDGVHVFPVDAKIDLFSEAKNGNLVSFEDVTGALVFAKKDQVPETVKSDSLHAVDLSELSKITRAFSLIDSSALPSVADANSPAVITLSSTDAVNFFPMDPTGGLIFQGEQSTPASASYLSSVVLEEGEITANPLKLSFNNDGQLVNVADVNAISAFRMKEASAEQLAEYAVTHEPIPVSFEPATTTRIYFDHLDLSAINPALTSESLNIGVNFTNSTQFATPFTVNDLKQTWRLTGTAENDTIVGSIGNDWIAGLMGVDKMTGGLGADKFTFYNAEETGLTAQTRDIITDFKHSEGDKIDVSLMLTEPVMHDFSFIGAKAFSKTDATGQLRFDTATHILYGSTDADNKAEFSIQLNGVKSLVADDFICVEPV